MYNKGMEDYNTLAFTDLTGKLLLAAPAIGDERFSKAVIFVCAHDSNGAMGLVVNNRMPDVPFPMLLGQLDIEPAGHDTQIYASTPVLQGGPVEGARGFLLHSRDFQRDETIAINDHAGISGTIDALKEAVSLSPPQKMLFVLGYAGWGAGQIEAELQQNAWLVAESSPSILFDSPPEDKWRKALASLGITPASLSHEAGRA